MCVWIVAGSGQRQCGPLPCVPGGVGSVVWPADANPVTRLHPASDDNGLRPRSLVHIGIGTVTAIWLPVDWDAEAEG